MRKQNRWTAKRKCPTCGEIKIITITMQGDWEIWQCPNGCRREYRVK